MAVIFTLFLQILGLFKYVVYIMVFLCCLKYLKS